MASPKNYLIAALLVFITMANTVTLYALPTVTTDSVYYIEASRAECAGTLVSDGGYTITDRGFCFSQLTEPTLDDSIVSEGTGTGSFTHILAGLMGNTTYYVRAYATNSEGTGYGNEISFTTEAFNYLCGADSVILQVENYDNKGVIEWQESIDTVHWATIPEIVGETFRFLPTETKYYRSVIKTSDAEPHYSAITFVQLPPVANAGADRIVGGTTMTLMGNQLEGSSGGWEIILGDSCIVAEPNNPYSQFTGVYEKDYKLVWSITNRCGQSTDTVNVRFEEISSRGNFIVVDNTDQLFSDSLEMAAGTYRIQFSDPEIAPFDSVMLIAMREDVSFLRKVVGFTKQHGIYTFTTEQGSFQDIFESGVINMGDAVNQGLVEETSTLKSASVFPTRKTIKNYQENTGIRLLHVKTISDETKPMLKATSAEEPSGGFTIPLPDIDIAVSDDHAVKLSISDAYIKISPNFVLDFDYEFPATLTKLKIGSNNGQFEYNFKTTLVATAAKSFVDKKEILMVQKHIIFMAGPVPVDIIAKFAIKSDCNMTVEGSIHFEERKNYKLNLTAIVEGDNVNNLSLNFKSTSTSTHEEKFYTQGEFSSQYKIGPEISFLVYGIVGPYLNIPAKLDMSICANTDLNWDADASIGIDGVIGAKAEIVVKKFFLPEIQLKLFNFSYPLFSNTSYAKFKFPYQLELLSGNFQSGTAGQKLLNPIVLQVTSNTGFGVPLVPVRLELEIGNGSVPQSTVITDSKGKMNIYWTLGANPENKLKVSVLDCDNNHIKNSPFYVYAKPAASNPCTNSNLSIVLKNDPTTIYPLVAGGVSPYNYSINGTDYSGTIPHFDVSIAGHNTMYVKDNNLCVVSKAFDINPVSACESSNLYFDALVQPNLLTVVAKNGKAPYTYAVDVNANYTSTNTFYKLTTGNHTIYTKDDNGCIVSKTVTIGSDAIASLNASYPAEGAKIIPASSIRFQWVAGNYSPGQEYDLYLNEDDEGYILISSNLSASSFVYNTTLSTNSNYEWKVVVKASDGSEIDFREFSFSTVSLRSSIYYEYWFNDDYDSRLEAQVSYQSASYYKNGSIATDDLSNGLHAFHTRFKDKKGLWSSVYSDYFHKITPKPSGEREIVAYEYWFNDDYSSKVLNQIEPSKNVNIIEAIDPQTLITGLHSIHYRYKDDIGQWSSVYSDYFHKTAPRPSGEREIVAYEYWFNCDYSSKVLKQIAPSKNVNIIEAIDPQALMHGLHSIHYRYKDDIGQWSSIYSDYFHKLNNRNSQSNLITSYRYWFDSDVAGMQQVSVPTPVSPYELLRDINLCSFPDGNHTIHFQFKDSYSAWSSVLTDTITKIPCVPTPETRTIQNELFLNGDESCFGATQTISVAGNGTTVVFQSGSITNLIAGQHISILPGFHAQSGSLLNAYITNDGTFCDGSPAPIVALPETRSKEQHSETKPEILEGTEKFVKVYPNPNNGQFTLELTNVESGAIIYIYNLLGAAIYQSTTMDQTSCKINLPGIKRGIYFVKVTDQKEQFTKKMIVN